MGPGTRKLLTGIVHNRFPNVHPEYLSRIPSGIHKLRTGQVAPGYLDKYARSLEGKIRYVTTLTPRRGKKLRIDLESAQQSRFQR